MSKLNLSAPWVTYVNELKAMFAEDPEIMIQYNDEEKEVKMYVTKQVKADALERILKPEVRFGNVVLKIIVVPANEKSHDILDDFRDAFYDNGVLQEAYPIESPFGVHRYAGFEKRVVQFYNDQLDDPKGNKSMLLQEIAKDIFKDDLSVNYYTVDTIHYRT